MNVNRHSGLALILVAFGVVMLLGKLCGLVFGFGFGLHHPVGFFFRHMMGLFIPVIMVVLGYIGVKNGRGLIGWALMSIGCIILLGKLAGGLIGIMAAIALIGFGISMLKKQNVH